MRHQALLASFALLPALATPLVAQRMFTLDTSRHVHEIDLTTGVRTLVGQVSSNAGVTAGFTYDVDTGRLWLTSTGNDACYLVDVTNWRATLVGNYGIGSTVVMHGIEWDRSTNTLYAMSSHDNGLYTIDQQNGAATLVGTTGLLDFSNIAYDLATNTMFMVNSNTDSLYSIDRATAQVTLIGALGAGTTNANGFAFNSDNQTLYMTDNLTDNFYAIDPATGAATVIGSTAGSNLLGLVYIPGTGRLTRTVHGCGPTTIKVTGHPAPGSTFVTEVGAVTGVAVVGYGVTSVGLPFCGCTVGHDWLLANVAATGSDSLSIPPNPAFAGLQLFVQAADFLGAGGCADPQLTLTDTITITL